MSNISRKYENDKFDNKIIDNQIIIKVKRNNTIDKSIYHNLINYSGNSQNYYKKELNKIKEQFENKINYLENKYSFNLPYNISCPFDTKLQLYHFENIHIAKRDYSRLYYWIEAAVTEFPMLFKFIKSSQSKNGQNSPNTFINLWKLHKLTSPGKLDFILRKLYYKCNEINSLITNDYQISNTTLSKQISKFILTFGYLPRPNTKNCIKFVINTFYHKSIFEREHYKLFNNVLKSCYVDNDIDLNRLSINGITELNQSYKECLDVLIFLNQIKNKKPEAMIKLIT